MKSKGSLVVALVIAFLLGAALPVLVVWNPGRWHWAADLAARMRWTPAAAPPGGEAPEKRERKVKYWRAPMDPNYISDKPGKSPMGMDLIPVYEDEESVPEKTERRIKYWRAPMDPNYISDKPGKSPMGMDLIPVYEDETPAESGIRVDPNFLQNFSVRTAVAERGSIPVDIRTVGVLDYNQKDIVSINTKFEGWIEKASVNYIGELVRRGDVLFEIYSPQLVTTQQEYLATVRYLERLSPRGEPEAIERARSLLAASRERLHYWDISDSQIDELRHSGALTRTLKIFSPVSGIVTFKMGDSLEGMKLSPGMNVYKIADLSTVWARVEVYEYQLRYVQRERAARITLDAFPGRRWSGKIIYIDPTVNPQTRTLKAYVEIPNPDWKLRPEMYADVEISVPAVAGAVKVPEEAILHTGDRNIVVVQKGKAIFEPREVELGAAGGGYQEVRRGLRAGETVVTSSQFLIDSESNLKEAINKILAAKKNEGGQQAEPEHQHEDGRQTAPPPQRSREGGEATAPQHQH